MPKTRIDTALRSQAELENDCGVISYREGSERLNRVLVAWLRDNNSIKHLSKMLGTRGCLAGRYHATDIFADIDPREFDHGFLDWFDKLMMNLHPQQNDIMMREAIHLATKERGRGYRHRVDDWAEKFNLCQRSYYNVLKETREFVVVAIQGRVR